MHEISEYPTPPRTMNDKLHRLLKYLKEHCAFTIDHNKNAIKVRLTVRVGLNRQIHVCPVISLVTCTDQG